jgi:hypothetical protein
MFVCAALYYNQGAVKIEKPLPLPAVRDFGHDDGSSHLLYSITSAGNAFSLQLSSS